MKNLNYFPYERNKYFYGKLLSVDDFESEQRYMNDKRRLINRFMHGCGVVCGLGVVLVDDDTISLEAGLALDFAGREIVVDKPVLKRLPEIEGFMDDPGEEGMGGYQYLCIEYAEHEREPVYGIADGAKEEDCYNKTAESFRIYLTGQEPEQGGRSDARYEEWKTIYWGNGIRISQVFPRYVESGKEFECRFVVENMGQKLPISFGFELVFDCINHTGKKWMKITFDESEWEKARSYEIPVILRAADVIGVKGKAAVREGSFWLKAGDSIVEEKAEISRHTASVAESTVEITDEDVGTVISRRYFADAMQEIVNHTYHQSIYLAKIYVAGAGSDVVIEGIVPMPFRQYIFSDVLTSVLERVSDEEVKEIKRSIKRLEEAPKEERVEKAADTPEAPLTAEGTVTISLGIGGMAGQSFFSKPVTHGLGPGKVIIRAGLAQGEEERYLCYGAGDVFCGKECPVQGEVAARADTSEGTFVAGIKLTEPTTEESVKIHWMALRGGREKNFMDEEWEMFIKPDMVYLSLREDYYFEAVFYGAHDTRVTWSVREAVGGTIDENGMYTAPNVSGIYEIVAKSEAYPGLTASAFAVVRDTHRE